MESIYIAGSSEASWGTPVHPFQGDRDAFVAKLNSNGVRQWNTFLGSASIDAGSSITVDVNGKYLHRWK